MTAAKENTHRLEMACVGLLLERTDIIDAFYQQLPIEDFGPQTRRIATAVMDVIEANIEINPMSVMEQLRRNGNLLLAGGGPFLHDCLAAAHEWVDAHAAIEALGRLFGLREAWAATVGMQQKVETGDLTSWVGYAREQVERIAKIDAGSMPPMLTYLRDVLTGEDVSVEWCIPGLIPAGTATMITAEEGIGKSTILQQLALTAAAGLTTFEPWRDQDKYEPQRVLLIDCENPYNKLVRSLRALWSYGSRFAPGMDTMNMAVESHQGGLDLSSPQDQGWLHQVVRTHRPQLVVIGPVYRFTSANLEREEEVRTWQRPLEQLLADGISVVTEHHAPNEQSGQLRSLRPIGSSVMRRWFAQGIGVRARKCGPHEDKFCRLCRRKARIEAWRGSREEEAIWPLFLEGAADGQVWWQRDEYAEQNTI